PRGEADRVAHAAAEEDLGHDVVAHALLAQLAQHGKIERATRVLELAPDDALAPGDACRGAVAIAVRALEAVRAAVQGHARAVPEERDPRVLRVQRPEEEGDAVDRQTRGAHPLADAADDLLARREVPAPVHHPVDDRRNRPAQCRTRGTDRVNSGISASKRVPSSAIIW